MNRGLLKTCLCMLAVGAAPSYALSISPATDYTISQTAVYDASREVTLGLKIGMHNQCDSLKASLVQRATALATTLDERTIADCNPDANGGIPFSFTTPTVVRVTRLTWEVQNCDLKQHCEAAGDFNFVVLPADYLQALIDWSAAHTVFVADSDGWLVAFLDRIGVQYTEDARAVDAESEVVTLVTVADSTKAAAAQDLPVRLPKRIIEFHDYPSAQPMVWVESSADGTIIAVRYPLIHGSEKDAANKKLFNELFQRLF